MTFVVPMIAYEDGTAAMDWLIEAFGFVEADRRISPDGALTHGELEVGDGIIMLATPMPDYQGPKHHRENCEVARKWSRVPYIIDGVLVQVDNVDAHCERARAAGAVILSEPETTDDGRRYRAEDLEGHRWMFEEKSGDV
ncbi:MAG TPA: VOC family protein [Candidatus Limnocylindria bacterium]|nr:VOC family protein [Candidatus Limnocylindria bacterium]